MLSDGNIISISEDASKKMITGTPEPWIYCFCAWKLNFLSASKEKMVTNFRENDDEEIEIEDEDDDIDEVEEEEDDPWLDEDEED